jgi:hypothetical protein
MTIALCSEDTSFAIPYYSVVVAPSSFSPSPKGKGKIDIRGAAPLLNFPQTFLKKIIIPLQS